MTCGTVILAISVAAIGVAWEAEKRAVVPATRMMLALGHLLRRRAYDARPPSGSGDPRPDPRPGRWRSRRAACRAGIGSRGRLRRLNGGRSGCFCCSATQEVASASLLKPVYLL